MSTKVRFFKGKITTMTRLQEALFNVLNDEFDLAQEPFFQMWRELEDLLARHGMVSDPAKTPPLDLVPIGRIVAIFQLDEPRSEPQYEFGAHLKGYNVHSESVWNTEQEARNWIRRATTLPDKWIACKRARANQPREWEDLP